MAKPLTARSIETIKPTKMRREIPDGLLPGLYLVVQPSGTKSWAVRSTIAGKSAKLTIGPATLFSLAEARERARDMLRKRADGIDPRTEKPVLSFAETAERFLERYAKVHTRESSWREAKRILERDVPSEWNARPISEISRADVGSLLDAIMDEGKPVKAIHLLAVVRKLFNWAVERSLLDVSPCQGIKAPAPSVSRDRILSDNELVRVWKAAGVLGYPFGGMIRLLILTGQRREEIAGLTREEIDLDVRLLRLKGERTKNGNAHEVPLSAHALAVLAELPPIASKRGFLFTTNGETSSSGFSKAKKNLDSFLAKDGGASLAPWTFHDLRRTFASGLARLGVPMQVSEKILNHVSGSFSGVAGVYNRHDYAEEKRQAMKAWGDYVTRLVE